jgi:hypothetical protein
MQLGCCAHWRAWTWPSSVMNSASPGATSRSNWCPVPSSATDSLATIRCHRRCAPCQRTDAVGVAEGQQAVAGDQRDHGIRAPDALVHRRTALKHRRAAGHAAAGHFQFVRQHVEQHFGVALGVGVAVVDANSSARSAWALVRLPLCTMTMPKGAFT